MNGKTGAELREQAAQHERDAAESFERSDTDGFVSQWASGINAQVARKNADIAEAGGVATFERVYLVTLDGQETDARRVRTKYGLRWRLDSTDEWLPFMPARESTLAKRGYKEVTRQKVAPAKAETWAPPGAKGLAGATQVQVVVNRTDVRKGEQDLWRVVQLGEA